MNILLIGSGGREHALAWSLADSPLTSNLVIAPGNPGMTPYGEMRPVAADDLDGLCALAVEISADLVVIGPEVPLVDGLADRLTSLGKPPLAPAPPPPSLKDQRNLPAPFVRATMFRSQPIFRSAIMPPPASILISLAAFA